MMNYSQFVMRLSDALALDKSDYNFVVEIPAIIDYAEQRIYRELDLLATLITDSTGITTASQRDFTLPATFITVENVSIITPASTTADLGVRNPLMPVSIAVMDLLWPSNVSATGIPSLFAMRDNATLILGPTPNDTYYVQVRGTQRPTPLSPSNSTTILTTYIPDVFLAAAAVYTTKYDDKAEAQYQLLKQSAEVEQFRAKFQSQSWSSQKPTPANPSRN